MIIKYQLISTSGNPTAIIYGRFTGAKKQKINQEIFKTNKLVEQIGYLYCNNGLFKFEMMGNEFSGNGCRAAGFSLLKFKTGLVKFRSSGINKILKVSSNKDNFTTLSIPYKFPKKQIINTNLGLLVKIFGSDLLVIEKSGNIDLARKIIKDNFKFSNAVGLIFIKRISELKISLNPFFYVKKTDTLINETACGSGSIAATIYLKMSQKNSLNKLEVIQPSTESIFVKLNIQNGEIEGVKISGPIKFLGNCAVKV